MSKKYKNKLFLYLDCLENDELFRLERFVESKFFNHPKEERLRKLFREIRKARLPGGTFSELNPQQFKVKPTDFSDLLKLVKDYIAYTEFQKDEQLQKRCLLKGLRSRSAKEPFKLLLDKEIRASQSNSMEDTPTKYQHLMYLYELKFKNSMIERNRHKKNAIVLQEFACCMDRYYALLKIQCAISMLDMSALNAHEFDYGDLEIFKSILANHPIELYPLLHVRFAYLKFVQKPDKDMYKNLKDKVLSTDLTFYEKKQFLELLLNFASKKTRHSNVFYWYEELLKINEIYFNLGIAFAGIGSRKGKILPQRYINYMRLLITLNLMKKARKFEKEYAHKRLLTKQNREFITLYDSIVLTKYKDIKALEYMERKLSVMREPDLYYRIIFEVIAIKTTYNCHHRTFTHKRERFRDYIRHQKQLGKEFKKIYLNFATLTRRLHNFQQKKKNDKPLDTNRLQALHESIQTIPTIERIWLLEKHDELAI